MTDVFLGFLNRSLSAAILIFAIVLIRLVFKKAPKWLLCALWALAAVRLLCPVSVESVLSLYRVRKKSFSDQSLIFFSQTTLNQSFLNKRPVFIHIIVLFGILCRHL